MATLILDYHTGADGYSDGPVEDELLALVAPGRDYAAVLAGDSRWPVLYHLSPERRNLLEWYPFPAGGDLLEVGCGCGALTGLFCEKAARVCAVDLSARRCRITAARHAGHANLEIIAGNLFDLPLERRFDVITLVGVLEYARSFVKTPRPYADFLGKLAGLLRPGGTLLVAVENRFGLKYLAGAPDDHTGRPFDGIQGFPGVDTVETFSRVELAGLLAGAGFDRQAFYYPYPDYKLPSEIFSDDYLPQAHHILHDAPNYDFERYRLFSEKKAYVSIIRGGQYPLFANSFLVAAGRRDEQEGSI